MNLFHRDLGGGGEALVILHGLLGSSRNWMGAGKDLAADFRVLAPDLRNHGESPHDPVFNYEVLAQDVVDWMDQNALDAVFLMGHSVGGKAAMRVACLWPERVKALVVVDISPAEKEPTYRAEFDALNRLPLDRIASRVDAERLLAEEIPDRPMRQFLLTNLARDEGGGWRWQPNLESLTENLDETGKAPICPGDRYDGRTLFVLGGKSRFVGERDRDAISEHFPQAQVEVVEKAGHNPHVEARDEFVRRVREFL